MFLAVFICQLALVAANPFHKYPYVFLLDVGNEEIKKTNTSQIRLSAPGGSLALRYPAVGTSDTIAHVRVSGIDFGTDLKANIVDGGPGYKYVVIVLMGNQGAPYDAVITVQTVSDADIDGNQSGDMQDGYNNYDVSENENHSAEVTDDDSNNNLVTGNDENVSAEDTKDDEYITNTGSASEQIKQQSANIYSYVNSAALDQDTDDNTANLGDTNEDLYTPSEIHKQSSSVDTFDSAANHNEEEDEVDETLTRENMNPNFIEKSKSNIDQRVNEAEPSHYNDDYGNEDDEDIAHEKSETYEGVDKKAYEKYQSAMPWTVYDGMRIYPQYAVPFALPTSDNSVYSPDDLSDSDQLDKDRYVYKNSNKYRDTIKNDFDADDASAIAS